MRVFTFGAKYLSDLVKYCEPLININRIPTRLPQKQWDSQKMRVKFIELKFN